jgi:hypothetical protein
MQKWKAFLSFDAFGDKELLKARIDAVASQGKRRQ